VKKDFYIYSCLKEIHRRKQAEIFEKKTGGILLILNTPGSLEHFMVHTDPRVLSDIFDILLHYIIQSTERGSIEFGYKLDKGDHLSFYVSEPGGTAYDQNTFEKEMERESNLLSRITEALSGLGGIIWIERQTNAARTFWFTVDIQPPGIQKVEEPESHASRPRPDWSEKTILIVDDVETNLLLLEGFLVPTQARVISVNNGLKAVNAVKKNGDIDFILMDVRMPVLDGYEATRRIKRIKPWLPVVAVSAYPGSAESDKWKDAGCDAFLGKPLNISELFDVISSLFEKVPV
jgi:CheY-like chemotaxis protein